jgi:hypothetical protein
VDVVQTIESRRRSRVVRIGSTVGVVVAAGLVFWGFSRGDDDRSPPSDSSPGLVINGPAEVLTTQAVGVPAGSAPATADVPVVPVGTADVAFPPVSSDIAAP